MDIVRYGLDKPVSVIVAVILLITFGIIGLNSLPVQLTPDVEKPQISVQTTWGGATPYEIEKDIIEKQEEVLKGLNGLTKMESSSYNNFGEITLTFALGTDLDDALLRVSNKLNEVRQYPETQDTVVTVTTFYPGASSELVKGFITTPLQQAIAEADGIDFLSATSSQGRSVIEARMVLDYDPKAAVSEIQAKVASQRNVLPDEADDPVIDSTTGERIALMYMAFYSDTMSPPQITDYLLRVVQPKLQAVPGVAKAELIGNKTYAMRIWLDPVRMAAFGITADEVRQVLRNNNYLAGVGQTKGAHVAIDLSATTDISQQQDFQNLVLRSSGDTLIRLGDVATTEMGAADYDSSTWFNGKTAIFIGIKQAPGANPLTVAGRIHELLPELREQLPSGLEAGIPYDASVFIEDSIREVFSTLIEAVLIVLFFMK